MEAISRCEQVSWSVFAGAILVTAITLVALTVLRRLDTSGGLISAGATTVCAIPFILLACRQVKESVPGGTPSNTGRIGDEPFQMVDMPSIAQGGEVVDGFEVLDAPSEPMKRRNHGMRRSASVPCMTHRNPTTNRRHSEVVNRPTAAAEGNREEETSGGESNYERFSSAVQVGGSLLAQTGGALFNHARSGIQSQAVQTSGALLVHAGGTLLAHASSGIQQIPGAIRSIDMSRFTEESPALVVSQVDTSRGERQAHEAAGGCEDGSYESLQQATPVNSHDREDDSDESPQRATPVHSHDREDDSDESPQRATPVHSHDREDDSDASPQRATPVHRREEEEFIVPDAVFSESPTGADGELQEVPLELLQPAPLTEIKEGHLTAVEQTFLTRLADGASYEDLVRYKTVYPKAKFDVNKCFGKENTTLLIEVAKHGGQLRLVRSFESWGANFNYQDTHGYTAFMWACAEGHYDMAKEILDVNHVDPKLQAKERKQKVSALHLVLCRGPVTISSTTYEDLACAIVHKSPAAVELTSIPNYYPLELALLRRNARLIAALDTIKVATSALQKLVLQDRHQAQEILADIFVPEGTRRWPWAIRKVVSGILKIVLDESKWDQRKVDVMNYLRTRGTKSA